MLQQQPALREELHNMNNLATALLRQRNYNQAEPALQQMLVLRWKTLGVENSSTLDNMNSLAVALSQLRVRGSDLLYTTLIASYVLKVALVELQQ